MSELIFLDGSQGEGGGQILRSALALSVVSGRAFRICGIRARRPKPGLMRQHLACVDAAARIGSATVEGATLGSQELTFTPGAVVPGAHEFKIASAGSTMLLLQTILPPLLLADAPSEVVLEGGTHNPFAPPFLFIERAFLPLLRRIGFEVEASLDRAGFYPNGGGRCRVQIRPRVSGNRQGDEADRGSGFAPLRLLTATATGAPALSATACLAGLPRNIAERELAVVRQRLSLPPERCGIEEHPDAFGPGNTLHVVAEADGFANIFTGFGALRVRSEQVAEEAVRATQSFLASGAAVDEHLADQLLLPLALARGGSFITTEPSGHTRTNIEVIREFLPNRIAIESAAPGQWLVTVEPQSIL